MYDDDFIVGIFLYANTLISGHNLPLVDDHSLRNYLQTIIFGNCRTDMHWKRIANVAYCKVLRICAFEHEMFLALASLDAIIHVQKAHSRKGHFRGEVFMPQI